MKYPIVITNDEPPMPYYQDIFISCKRFPERFVQIVVLKGSCFNYYFRCSCQLKKVPISWFADTTVPMVNDPIKILELTSKKYRYYYMIFWIYSGQCEECGTVYWHMRFQKDYSYKKYLDFINPKLGKPYA